MIQPQGADPPPPLCVAKAGRDQLNEEITILLPTGTCELYSQIISNLGHSTLLRRCELAPINESADLTQGALQLSHYSWRYALQPLQDSLLCRALLSQVLLHWFLWAFVRGLSKGLKTSFDVFVLYTALRAFLGFFLYVSMHSIPPLNGPNRVVKYILFVAQWSPADGIFSSYTQAVFPLPARAALNCFSVLAATLWPI